MKIIETSREMTSVEKYLMCCSNQATSVKDVPDGSPIVVESYILYETKKGNEDVILLSMLDKDKNVFVTQSKVFIENFTLIKEVLGTSPYSIIKVSGRSRGGRSFVDCKLDVSVINM